jgi:DNA invertase Pin-like site-specific DNA recombinase
VVLFWSLDRLSREGSLATLQHLERLTQYDGSRGGHQETYLDSVGTFKDVCVALMATLAKQEAISDATKGGLKRTRREGRILGRPRVRVALFDHALEKFA